jgi:hypothetical protein
MVEFPPKECEVLHKCFGPQIVFLLNPCFIFSNDAFHEQFSFILVTANIFIPQCGFSEPESRRFTDV